MTSTARILPYGGLQSGVSGQRVNNQYTPLIRSMHENNDPDFRWYAASALVLTGEPAIEPLILAMEDDTCPGVPEVCGCSTRADR